jgi:putative ATPase
MAGGDARRALTYLEAAAGGAKAKAAAEGGKAKASDAPAADASDAPTANASDTAAADASDTAAVSASDGPAANARVEGDVHVEGDEAAGVQSGDATADVQAGDDAADVPAEGDAAPRSRVLIDLKTLETAVDRAAVRYDRAGDQHYDVTSAMIKSIRGSDVDAAMHYLARMVEAGEDPRFIARRLVISASEDIGMGDPTALGVAIAAAEAVQLIGMPEARINLAQAVVALALAPKSNAVITAIDAAIADVKAGKVGPVPPHLRDAHYSGAKKLGHGSAYKYSHNDPRGVVSQQYAPDVVDQVDYYQPTRRGGEAAYADRVAAIRKILRDR